MAPARLVLTAVMAQMCTRATTRCAHLYNTLVDE